MRRIAILSFLAIALLCAGSAAASAAPVRFTIDSSSGRHDALTLDGDHVTDLSIDALASCSSQTSPNAVQITLPAGPVTLDGGALRVEGDAPIPAYPGAHVHYLVDASITPDHRVLKGSLTLSGLTTPFDHDCPATTTGLLGIPVPAPTAPAASHPWTYNGLTVQLDYRAGTITRLHAATTFTCGRTGSSLSFDSIASGLGAIPTTRSGRFALVSYALRENGDIVELRLDGQLGRRTLVGTIELRDVAIAGRASPDCAGQAAYTGYAPLPVETTHAGASAYFDWSALRVEVSPGAYRYYFLADHVRCSGGARRVRITIVGGPAHVVRCGARRGYASGPLEPGHAYVARVEALQLRRGRVFGHGQVTVVPHTMPTANDSWRPITGLPGPPPAR